MQEVDVDEPLGDEEGQGEEEGAIGRSKLMSYQGEERRMGRKMRARKRRGEGGGGYGATVKTNKMTECGSARWACNNRGDKQDDWNCGLSRRAWSNREDKEGDLQCGSRQVGR